MLLKSNMLDHLAHPKESSNMNQALANLCGLLFIILGSSWGTAVGFWLYESLGGLLGLTLGAIWGYQVAEGYALMIKIPDQSDDEALAQGPVTMWARWEGAPLSGSKRSWFSRILGRKPVQSSFSESEDCQSLEEIHRRLRSMNSQLWRELRQGVLSSCYAGLYTVQLEEAGEPLDWREINRRTVAALHRFETALNDEQRRASLNDALDRIGQKLVLVHKAAKRKADRLNVEEEREIQKNEAELWRLSRCTRVTPSQN